MEDGQSFEDSVRALANEAGEARQLIERDAHAFVEAMLSRRLLELVE
jgi:hypothetical protein